MLYDPKYQQRAKIRELESWLEKQDPNAHFFPYDTRNCLFAKFYGRPVSLSEIHKQYGTVVNTTNVIFGGVMLGAQTWDTYGNALARLRQEVAYA